MKFVDGGLYIGPWALRLLIAVPVLTVVAVFIAQLPDIKRYIKFETM